MCDSSEKLDLLKIPLAKEDCPCGYFPENKCAQIFTMSKWWETELFSKGLAKNQCEVYDLLKTNGFCRYYGLFYRYQCEECHQCSPIRVLVERFKPSKNQRAAVKRNEDIQVTLVKDSSCFVTDERALLLREYEEYHNGNQPGFYKKSLEEARSYLSEMNGGYSGIWNLEYRLNGRLVGVSILDYTEDSEGKITSLCSNYFYYDVTAEMKKRSLGIFSAMKELELCRELGVRYYYLGLYLNGCRKMNYKNEFEPYEILIDNVWVASDYMLPKECDATEMFPDICFITEDIDVPVLLSAYNQGIFPWFNEDEGNPVIWQSPDPRFVIPVKELHIPKTIRKFLKHSPYRYTMDTCFEKVIEECAKMERAGQNGTWIGNKIKKSYTELYRLGYAHSIEVWKGDVLAGGLYGVMVGSVFCGESMFTIESGSSSSAFILFAKAFEACGGRLIDCQVYTDNMARYGGRSIPKSEYLKLIGRYKRQRLLKDIGEAFTEIQKDFIKS